MAHALLQLAEALGEFRDRPDAGCLVLVAIEGTSGHREMVRLVVVALNHQPHEAQGVQLYDVLRIGRRHGEPHTIR